MKKRTNLHELAIALIQCKAKGGDIRQLLLDQGYTDPSGALNNLKQRIKLSDLDLYTQLQSIKLTRVWPAKEEKPIPVPAKMKTGEHSPDEQKAPETVVFAGKEYERVECEGKPVNYYREKPSPTCCQPARGSGVTVPDVLPLKIAALVSDIDPDYRYERTNVQKGKQAIMRLIWREPMGVGERCLNFTAEEWKRFAKEIPQALDQLGLDK